MSQTPPIPAFDILIAGGGPAGLAAAALAAEAGFRTALVSGPLQDRPDPRTVALMRPAIRLLEHLGIWPGTLAAAAAPLDKLRLIDDTGGVITAPTLLFDAAEAGSGPFGWNIPLAALVPALRERALALGGVTEFALAVTAAAPAGDDRRKVTLADGRSLTARLLIAADGRESELRASAGIATSRWAYDQTALVTRFAHSAPHRNISHEFHKPGGPFTTVPLPGNASSLVWMDRPDRIAALMALSPEALAREIQLESHGELGRISDVAACSAFPMQGLTARQFAAERTLLVGEAAHVVPPIGAQGLNMSLRDAALAIELAADADAFGDDIGSPKLLADYDSRRRADVLPRQAVIDVMNRSLLSDFLPMAALRGAGLNLVAVLPALRGLAMRQGLAPSGLLPRAMR